MDFYYIFNFTLIYKKIPDLKIYTGANLEEIGKNLVLNFLKGSWNSAIVYYCDLFFVFKSVQHLKPASEKFNNVSIPCLQLIKISPHSPSTASYMQNKALGGEGCTSIVQSLGNPYYNWSIKIHSQKAVLLSGEWTLREGIAQRMLKIYIQVWPFRGKCAIRRCLQTLTFSTCPRAQLTPLADLGGGGLRGLQPSPLSNFKNKKE